MNYSKWDKWANNIDENGDEKGHEDTPRPKCVFGKPMTEEEFKNRKDKDTTQVIQANQD